MRYSGSPWRSRFLRSPKIGLELTDREDFAAVDDLATVSLGAKTGCDEFFFLERTTQRAATASRIRVRGLTGWEGEIPKADLLPAVRSPKTLDVEREGRRTRLAAIPKRWDTYYLDVRDTRVDKVVREYVQYGEEQGVHRRDLVKSNAVGAAWYRQARARITSRWALPYNSGYDYAAVDNSVGALLNGRLVGVHPLDDVDAVLLGAVLNSTLTTVSRLLEGVATGNEGAFDVGPPSVRVMRVPDPRVIGRSPYAAEVTAAWEAILNSGVMPHAPLSDRTVPELRYRLDRAVLLALGERPGTAAVLQDRVYTSYARWRLAVESVEDTMQDHRRALSKRGGNRTVSAVVRAARTVHEEMQPPPLLLAELSTFDSSIELVDPVLRRDRTPDQGLLFEATVVLDQNGKPLDLGSEERLRLASYLRSLGMTGPLPIPLDPNRSRRVLSEAETATASHLAEATRRSAPYVTEHQIGDVAAAVHAQWLSESIKALRASYAPGEKHDDDSDEVEQDPSLFNPSPLVPSPPAASRGMG